MCYLRLKLHVKKTSTHVVAGQSGHSEFIPVGQTPLPKQNLSINTHPGPLESSCGLGELPREGC